MIKFSNLLLILFVLGFAFFDISLADTEVEQWYEVHLGETKSQSLSSQGQHSSANWHTFQYNAQHTGNNGDSRIEAPLTLIWSKKLGTVRLHQISTSGDRLLISHEFVSVDTNKAFMCLDADDGTEYWRVVFGEEVSSIGQPTVYNSRAYLQTVYPHHLAVFDIQTGSLLWYFSYRNQWDRFHAPLPHNGVIYMPGGTYGGLYAIDAETGDELWWNRGFSWQYWVPSAYGNGIYVFLGTILREWDPLTGEEHWNLQLITSSSKIANTSIYNWGSTPVIDTNSNIIYCTHPSYLTAVDLTSRQNIWQQPGVFWVDTKEFSGTVTPALDNDKLFAIEGTNLVAYNAADGVELWRFDPPNRIVQPPVTANGLIFVTTATMVYALEIATQDVIWSTSNAGRLTISENRLYIAGFDGTVYAYEGITTDIDDDINESLPSEYILYQNYPNPFNPTTEITYSIPRRTKVSIKIYNLIGQEVATLVDEVKSAGTYTTMWDGTTNLGIQVSSGIYLYRLITDNFSQTKKMLLLK